MKKALTGLALLATTLVGCGDRKEIRQTEVQQARQVWNVGMPKVIRINLSYDGVRKGPETRFYDVDGDGKTVEQYVELYSGTAGLPRPFGVGKCLVKAGYKISNTNSNFHCEPTEMTPEESVIIDKKYQALLDSYLH